MKKFAILIFGMLIAGAAAYAIPKDFKVLKKEIKIEHAFGYYVAIDVPVVVSPVSYLISENAFERQEILKLITVNFEFVNFVRLKEAEKYKTSKGHRRHWKPQENLL